MIERNHNKGICNLRKFYFIKNVKKIFYLLYVIVIKINFLKI